MGHFGRVAARTIVIEAVLARSCEALSHVLRRGFFSALARRKQTFQTRT
jgi:hypothetical protein